MSASDRPLYEDLLRQRNELDQLVTRIIEDLRNQRPHFVEEYRREHEHIIAENRKREGLT